jgi:glycogen operon protein
MIAFRKNHPTLSRCRFWRDDVRWHGTGQEIDMSYESRQLAFYLDGGAENDADLYVMINAGWRDEAFVVQQSRLSGWKVIVDTSATSPNDFFDMEQAPQLSGASMIVKGRSVVVLVRPRHAVAQ